VPPLRVRPADLESLLLALDRAARVLGRLAVDADARCLSTSSSTSASTTPPALTTMKGAARSTRTPPHGGARAKERRLSN
jgi:hypothetical protein